MKSLSLLPSLQQCHRMGWAVSEPDSDESLHDWQECVSLEYIHVKEHNPTSIPTPVPPPAESAIRSEAGTPDNRRDQAIIGRSGETRSSDQDDMSFHWKNCYNVISEYGSKTSIAWTDEMNTVLIFGALYSALVSAFLAVSYQLLREDPVSNSTSLNSSFIPSSSDVAVNVGWFSSLVLSLTAVLMALLVKQRLFHYTWTTDISL
ncbi:hypothetical protein EDD18DRAFT_378214, partial [Armillaria luteobubalina]